MADEGYYRDQPRFQQKDPLTGWSYVFLAVGAVAALWLLLLFILWSTERLDDDRAFGLTQGNWVGITAVILVACLIGLFFVIVARIGATQAGTYLSADAQGDLEEEPDEHVPRADLDDDVPEELESVLEESEGQRLIASTEQPPAPHAARIDDPFGPDGRMMLSYTVPEKQPRGVYGDTYILVENDQVLNVKTLLATTMRDRR